MKADLSELLSCLVKQVVHNLERWEATSPDPDQVFVVTAGGEGSEAKIKTIHEIVQDVREGNPEGQELVRSLLGNMMDQAIETQVGKPLPPFDAAAFEAQLEATREAPKTTDSMNMILENYRKATESTMKLQQDVLRTWTMQWPQMFGLPFTGGPASGSAMPGAAWLGQLSEAQKKWGETVTDMLNKHREPLDAQYKAGIWTIEEAFKVGEAKDPQQFRRLTEELWKLSFECLKAVADAQTRNVQAAMEKFYEVASKSASGLKV